MKALKHYYFDEVGHSGTPIPQCVVTLKISLFKYMKNYVFLSLFILNATAGFSQRIEKRQIAIVLNNIKGVPFSKDNDMSDYAINGFEIDSDGKFYFAGGKTKATLAFFKDSRQLFRKVYSEFPPSQLYIWQNRLYVFDAFKSNLWVLNPNTGAILNKYEKITTKRFDDYLFADSSLIIQTPYGDKTKFERFNLKGQYTGEAPGESNIAPFTTKGANGPSEAEFLGKWNDDLIFWDLVDGPNGAQVQRFWDTDQNGKILGTKAKYLAGYII
jgi:hypothetical protein